VRSVLATKAPIGTEYRTENPFCCGLRTSGERNIENRDRWSLLFYEDDRAVTVNSERYVAMIQVFFAPALEELNAGLVWFQQDGATAHTALKSMAVLREMFPGRLISLRGHISWPARSPDLTPCDYFLWGYLKAEVFKHRPRTLQELKDAIRLEVARIPHDMLDRVMRNIRICLQQFIDNSCHHLQDILFKTM